MIVYLETERLVLRRLTPDDLDAVEALDADPVVMRYINGGRPTPRDELRDDVLPAWLGYYDRGDRYGFWAAIEKPGGRFVGWFHLRPGPGDPDDEPELGYRLRADAWGRGYATEGARALVGKAFTELGARRVYATTMAVNTGSWRVMEKAGLRFVRASASRGPTASRARSTATWSTRSPARSGRPTGRGRHDPPRRGGRQLARAARR